MNRRRVIFSIAILLAAGLLLPPRDDFCAGGRANPSPPLRFPRRLPDWQPTRKRTGMKAKSSGCPAC